MKKKRNVVGALGKTAVALTLISTCLVGGTLAKYTSEVTGTGSAIAAKWEVAFKADSNNTSATTVKTTNFTLDALKDTRTSSTDLVADGKIAPGSTGSFAVEIDGKNTEVAYEYAITLDKTGLNGIPIKFYSDSAMTTEITTAITGSVKPSDADAAKKKAQVIYWKWDTPAVSGDSADTAIGTKTNDADRKASFTIKLEATQKLS